MARPHVHLVCFFRQHLRNCPKVPHEFYSIRCECCVRGEKPAGEGLVVCRLEAICNYVLDPLLRSIDVRSKDASIWDGTLLAIPSIELLSQPVDLALFNVSVEVGNVIERASLVPFLKFDLSQTIFRDFLGECEFIQPGEHRQVSSIKNIFDDATNGRTIELAGPCKSGAAFKGGVCKLTGAAGHLLESILGVCLNRIITEAQLVTAQDITKPRNCFSAQAAVLKVYEHAIFNRVLTYPLDARRVRIDSVGAINLLNHV